MRLWWPKFLKKPRLRLETPRIKMPRKGPPRDVYLLLSLVYTFFILCGGIRLISRGPINGFLVGGLMDQTVIEAIVVFGFLLAAFSGFMSIYESTKHIYRSKEALTLLIIGIVLVLTAYAGLQWLMVKKMPQIFGGKRS